ncbi:SrfA family protein [Erwinia sp. MMLR14_017]|uniref:SrfA family protein n=1 Tax=Erwinia sp. MMLR14_017 TaxID=3093842 RepID=UPI0029904AFF|nr:SrfA family protein [Erwinia sp. MMLR14_017]MDW8846169.1 SrfA family protein [Erwinia sp. MMLR14_017]
MAKSFLRSGSLDAVLPLGENGQPVYLSALQLRETLRLRKQQQIADCLAIPQPNDAGDRLDWYSPVTGKVTSWAAASDSARSHALNQLIACQQAVADMCQKAQQSEKTSQKLFGALLAKALQFPDQNFVYLVGGKPVLTFWGFVSLDKKSRQDALDCLRATEEDEPPLNLSKLAAPVVPALSPAAPVIVPAPVNAATLPEADAPLVVEAQAVAAPEPAAEAAPPAPETPAAAPSPAAKNKLIRYGWMLPAAALLIAFGIQLKGCVSQPEKPMAQNRPEEKVAAPEPAKTAAPAVKAPAPVAEVKPAEPVATAQKSDATLPVATASVSPPQTEAVPAVAEPIPEEPAPAPAPVTKEDLVMPADAVKLGSTKFLNGNWRVIVGGKNPITGKPPSLRYQLKNGKGIAKITQGDGISCRVEVYAGLMSSGNLVINSRTKAKCSDGSRYQMPELVCKQGATGAAECSGQYDANTVLPMTMKRESK